MRIRWTAAAVLAGALTSTVHAQGTVDVSRLPISLERIQRELRASSIREEREGLNLRYTVDVYAPAPPLVFLRREDNLVNGPVPYGGPTHKDMLEQMTPKEFRAPAADIGALLQWLASRAAGK